MDFSAIFTTWKNALTQPNEEFYINERNSPQANLTTALIWIVIAAVISAVFRAIGAFIGFGAMSGFMQQMMNQPDLPPEVSEMMSVFLSGGMMGGIAAGGIITSIIMAPIGFFIGTGIFHLIARLLGGQGDFGRYAYLIAAFQAPVMVISGILSLAAGLGGCLSFFVSIYAMVLTYFATKVEHQLTSGKAIATIVIPILVLIVIVGCVMIAAIGMFASMQ